MEENAMDKLKVIRDYLVENGIEAEIRNDRKEPYINIGEVKHVKNRVQFWIRKNTDSVCMYAGKEMGKWFAEAGKSVYLNPNWRASDKENEVVFPNCELALSFIKKISDM
jgi:hypothetical protein